MTLGEKIAKLRGVHRLSQEELAERVGVSRQSVSKWETGGSIPDLDKLVALSEVFSVTIDDLVKSPFLSEDPDPALGEIPLPGPGTRTASLPPSGAPDGGPSNPEAGAPSHPQDPVPSPGRYPTQKILGLLFLAFGLFSITLGLLLNLLLLFLGLYFLLCGIICLTVRRHPGLVIAWGTFLPVLFLLPRMSAFSLLRIFHPIAYEHGLDVPLIVSYCFWAALLALVLITARVTPARRHPFLLCGWVILSQVYGFIPIAFLHGEGALPFYLGLSWAVLLLLVLLLIGTGRAIFQYRRSKSHSP